LDGHKSLIGGSEPKTFTIILKTPDSFLTRSISIVKWREAHAKWQSTDKGKIPSEPAFSIVAKAANENNALLARQAGLDSLSPFWTYSHFLLFSRC